MGLASKLKSASTPSQPPPTAVAGTSTSQPPPPAMQLPSQPQQQQQPRTTILVGPPSTSARVGVPGVRYSSPAAPYNATPQQQPPFSSATLPTRSATLVNVTAPNPNPNNPFDAAPVLPRSSTVPRSNPATANDIAPPPYVRGPDTPQFDPYAKSAATGTSASYDFAAEPVGTAGRSVSYSVPGGGGGGGEGYPSGTPATNPFADPVPAAASTSYAATPEVSQETYAKQHALLTRHYDRIVAENRLQAFYPPARLQEVVRKVAAVDFTNLSSFWRIPTEIAYDLATLALYDVVFFCDDSGSMKFEEGGERIDDLKLILEKVAEVAVRMDDDGVSVRFMNSPIQGDNIRTPGDVASLVSRVNFTGMTPLGTQLQRKVLRPMVLDRLARRELSKPVYAIVITDGEPVGEERGKLKHVILDTKQEIERMGLPPTAVAFTIAQCGKDVGAQRFLQELDNDPQVGGMIDAMSYYELECEEFARKGVDLTPELFLVKLCVGGIDRTYDEQDE
ncbi:hypothetical protein HDU96_002074 [Phlyctochytrium bullatum]|nr:hypothetical protein HDU96_002074 [Phlyctochytrium bullatum]